MRNTLEFGTEPLAFKKEKDNLAGSPGVESLMWTVRTNPVMVALLASLFVSGCGEDATNSGYTIEKICPDTDPEAVIDNAMAQVDAFCDQSTDHTRYSTCIEMTCFDSAGNPLAGNGINNFYGLALIGVDCAESTPSSEVDYPGYSYRRWINTCQRLGGSVIVDGAGFFDLYLGCESPLGCK